MDTALADGSVIMSPPVLSELLSDSNVPAQLERELRMIPLLEILPGYWARAGKLRAALRGRGHRAKLIHTLIAQSCLDHDVPLLTRDRGFPARLPNTAA